MESGLRTSFGHIPDKKTAVILHPLIKNRRKVHSLHTARPIRIARVH
jgi:hypothetical protein